jgi:hypothetical protein
MRMKETTVRWLVVTAWLSFTHSLGLHTQTDYSLSWTALVLPRLCIILNLFLMTLLLFLLG